MSSAYTDADVQAARQALIEASVSHYEPEQQPQIRAFAESMFGPSDPSVTTVLDAVAPAIAARAKAEALREAAESVQSVWDMQCPVRPAHDYASPWARVAHQWWEKVLAGRIDDIRRRADEIEAAK